MQIAFTKTEPPQWLLDMWKEIEQNVRQGLRLLYGTCSLQSRRRGLEGWIRNNLKPFIDTGFTARHRVTEYWDAGLLKVFRGVVDMKPDDRSRPTIHPTMSHFFYMDDKDQTKVRWWVGAVGPVSFS
jgi:hypothetical protein